MKRILPLLLILLLILTGCSAKNADSPAADAPTDTPLTGTYYVQIDVKDYGTIVAELYADIAPHHRRELPFPRGQRLLRRLDLPPHHFRLHDSGRRPERQRHGRFKPAD